MNKVAIFEVWIRTIGNMTRILKLTPLMLMNGVTIGNQLEDENGVVLKSNTIVNTFSSIKKLKRTVLVLLELKLSPFLSPVELFFKRVLVLLLIMKTSFCLFYFPHGQGDTFLRNISSNFFFLDLRNILLSLTQLFWISLGLKRQLF